MSTEQVLAKVMTFIYVLSAARHDATPAQLAELREHVVPEVKKFRVTGDPAPVVKRIREIMGADWQPTGEFGDAARNPLGPIRDHARRHRIDLDAHL